MANKKRGVTVIEMIVVIAAILFLSAVVLANINSAKNKAKDAAIKENMSHFFQLANDYYGQHGNFGGFCEWSEVGKLFDAIPASPNEKICQHENNNWFVCAYLNFPENRTKAWCTDKSGVRKQIDAKDCKQGKKSCP